MRTKVSSRTRVISLLGSNGFFWLVVGIFVAQAVWIALSGRYPMAFDEDFHFGVIRIYAHHLSPILSGQPAGADTYGAVARDSSYLYHYLMSFPYRVISAITDSQYAQVIFLRFINIALMASSLAVYRKVMLRVRASRAIINISLLIFVLLPVVPLLGAQINYDNLFLPLCGLTFLAAMRLDEGLREHSRLDLRALILTLSLCLVTSLVKYAFLPIFAAILGYFAVRLFRTFATWRDLWRAFGRSFASAGKRNSLLLITILVASAGLFVQRDVVNVVRYHTPVPDCSKVLSVKDCSAYGPWIRDYNFKINKLDEERSPLVFTADWLYGMWLRIFFSLGGPSTTYQTRGPLTIGAVGAIGFAGIGLGLVVVYGRKIFRDYDPGALWLLSAASVCYVATLWLDEYLAYVRTGQPVAINGRYLLPVLLPMLLIIGLAASEALKRLPDMKVLVAGVAVISLLWGGGALTYILRSNDTWDWQNEHVLRANHVVQGAVGPVTPGYYQQTLFLK